MFCSQCGKPVEDQARFCPHCGASLMNEPEAAKKGSLWMAITALTFSIITFILLLAALVDLSDAMALAENPFFAAMGQAKLKEEAMNMAVGGLVFLLPGIFGIVSLAQKRGGTGMAAASIVINAINLLFILGFFGITLE